MTAKGYVNKIVKKIQCSGSKKKEIKKQLLLEIEARLAQGEALDNIFVQMGTAEEIADGFNESISPSERKKYKRYRIIKILLPIFLFVIILGGLVYWILPKGVDIEKSEYFSKAQVEEEIKKTIELFNREDYDSLQEKAIPQMAFILNKGTMDKAKKQVGDNWGRQQQLGTAYVQEIVQRNQHFAIGQIVVTYENINVTYTITFDSEMKLAGLYMK